MKIADRFWSKVDRTGGPDACWPWLGAKSNGYGRFGISGTNHMAYRVSYELTVGQIPDRHDVHHRCENPPCVNPAHLEALTRREHAARGKRANLTHCPQGHEYSVANTYWSPATGRMCRTCQRAHNRAHYQRTKQLVGYHNARKTHCPQGHPYDGDNTYVQRGGGRVCRECLRGHVRAHYNRNRERILSRQRAQYHARKEAS